MTALAASASGVKKKVTDGAPILPSHRWLPVAASQLIYYGALVVEVLGYAKEATGTAMGHLKVAGVARGSAAKGEFSTATTDADNSSGAAGDLNVKVEAGVFTFVNDSGAGALTVADGGLPCYVVDDATVSRNGDVGNRAIAGIFLGLDDDDRAIVAVGMDSPHGPRIFSLLANADLSSLQHTFIKLADDTGDAEAAGAGAATDPIFGVLLNAPTAGTVARICTYGPAPIVVGAGGITAGTRINSVASGAAENAAAGEESGGFALETGTSAQTKMMFVCPGTVPA